MLILSRKCDEAVVIGGSRGFDRLLKVTVIQITGGMVKLGIEAPDDIPVHRWEVWKRIRATAVPAAAPDAVIHLEPIGQEYCDVHRD